MKVTVRKMVHEDIKQVQDVAKTTWHDTYEGVIPIEVQNNFLSSAYSDEGMRHRLERSFLYVAEVDEQIVGFANFSPVKKDGKVELGAIYLYPEFQGNGIGSALLQHGIKELEGIKEIYINVEKDNKIGKAFYDAKGFEIISEFDDNFGGYTFNTVRMVLRVNH
ncbi:GNAT family N-acetyltransferase [Alkalihalobacterium bogoriense]|uniref:GNAT family N-acetyltransferase n=1 Tax=Alkalihalobacterium bogoriense TaxID=246272 RepID=UPI00047D0579|nr:GNAT family N-acetyltransferase [Alkalihalobacterium bogoriense]